MKIKTILPLILAAASSIVSVEIQADSWQEIGSYYQQELKSLKVVGGAAALVKKGSVVGSVYYGDADQDKGYKVDANTLFHWASITKTFTGIAIMQLRDRGKLKLSDSVMKYLPEIGAVHNEFGNTDKITIKQLLSHTSGFRAPSFPWKDKKWQPHEPTEFSQLVAMMPYSEIKFEPGSQFGYSNLGVNFLGEIVRRLTGDTIMMYVDKNIFKPLKMHNAYFDTTPYHLQKHRSNNYYFEQGELNTGNPEFDTGVTAANGGLNASVKDMTKYLAFLIGDDKQPIFDGILKRSSLLEMWQPLHNTKHKTNIDEQIAISFFERSHAGRTFVGHTGGQKNFSSAMFISPESKAGFVFVYNTGVWAKDDKDKFQDLTSPLFKQMQLKLFKLMAEQ
ncbi:MAG: beta-lactamase family protein [Algicola sp.]|nr:beta-lactamase family protein [Algicola sp.]